MHMHLGLLWITVGCGGGTPTANPVVDGNAVVDIVPIADVVWEALNPARGDQSPRAATLWGDRKGAVPTGFLVKFVDGFSSPPHIHNVAYRGVVLDGEVHNDDPEAESMWMASGSYWTQPAGQVHITSARGEHNVAFIEIDVGPYLVRPPGDAFDDGERPVNVDASNLTWLGPSNLAFLDGSGVAWAPLWGAPGPNSSSGSLLEVAPRGSGHIRADAVRMVVVRGRVEHSGEGRPEARSLEAGSLVRSQGPAVHRVSCRSTSPCWLYVRADGEFSVVGE